MTEPTIVCPTCKTEIKLTDSLAAPMAAVVSASQHALVRRTVRVVPSYPSRHWELDEQGQLTQQIIEKRRRADFITPIPKPKKRKGSAEQAALQFDEGKGLSTEEQRYDHTAIIQSVREQVDRWRQLPNSNDWRVTPETARLLGSGREQLKSHGRWAFAEFTDVYEIEADFKAKVGPAFARMMDTIE